MTSPDRFKAYCAKAYNPNAITPFDAWQAAERDMLERLTAGNASLPEALRFTVSIGGMQGEFFPGEWCKAHEVADYGDHRAAAAVLVERERCALLADNTHPHDFAFIGSAIRKGTP